MLEECLHALYCIGLGGSPIIALDLETRLEMLKAVDEEVVSTVSSGHMAICIVCVCVCVRTSAC